MNYKCYVDGIDFDPQVTNPDGYKANINMTSYIILWEPKSTLSISENEREENLVYPKISNSNIYINSDKIGNGVKHVQIYDNHGKEIQSLNIAGETINISSFNSGLYHIIIDDGQKRKTSSFIKN